MFLTMPAESVVLRHSNTQTLISATGTNITGPDYETYTFASPVGGAYVQIHPDSAATLYVKWNAAAASTTAWDVVLTAAGVSFCQIDGDITGGIIVTTVTIYSATDQTLGTDFVVKGIQLQ